MKSEKFENYIYQRPKLEEVKDKCLDIKKRLETSSNYEDVQKTISEFNALRGDIDTAFNLCSIRHSINTIDEFYEAEQNWFDENSPYLEEALQEVLQALVVCKYRNQLEKEYGTQWFKLIECAVNSFSSTIIEELQEENRLTTEYGKLKASAKIEFNGQVYNLAQMGKFVEDEDRDVRYQANEAVMKFYEDNEDHFDEILDKLVKVRCLKAKKMGFDNYADLAYLSLSRTDYNKDDVKKYREQVLKDLVPFVCELQKEKAQRLGVDKLYNYDLGVCFKSGNAKINQSKDELVSCASLMYSKMSPETKEFFEFMVKKNLLDLEAKPNKELGGYCTSIYNYSSPFIFSNFNGTSADVDVLTHEAGHAFQLFSTLKTGQKIIEYQFPTLEACEIHSMSMELFTYPYMEYFFKEETNKYLYQHLVEAICFIPYGVTVDEFQHELYSHPELSKKERKELYRKIEKKYMPYKFYDNDFLNRGGFFFKQGHIFEVPYYYIDYTLAQVCAFQFFIKDINNHEEAWNDYKDLCCVGGSKSFLSLLEVGKIKNPFIDGTIKSVIGPLKDYLNQFDKNELK